MIITAVEAAVCRVALPQPVRLGAVEHRTRDYVLLRLSTDDGLHGFAYGAERGTPILKALESLGQRVLGSSPLRRRATIQAMEAANPIARPALIPAISLLEIALWDLAAKGAGLALHQLLGGGRERVPLMPVCGYFLEKIGEDGLHEQLREFAGQGFAQIKLIGSARPPHEAERFVGACRDAVGPDVRLAVDVHFSLAGVHDAVAFARALEGLDVSFLEDPFPSVRWRELRALAARVRIPLAAGEDAIHPAALADLTEAASVLRPDASFCGGIAAAVSGIEAAGTAGATVIPHVLPAIHAQLAAAYPQVTCVEAILPEIGADPIDTLMTEPLQVEGGEAVVSTAPGHGVAFDWDAVAAAAAISICLR